MGRDHWTSGPQGKAHEVEKAKHTAGANSTPAPKEGAVPPKSAPRDDHQSAHRQSADPAAAGAKYDPISLREGAGAGRRSLDAGSQKGGHGGHGGNGGQGGQGQHKGDEGHAKGEGHGDKGGHKEAGHGHKGNKH